MVVCYSCGKPHHPCSNNNGITAVQAGQPAWQQLKLQPAGLGDQCLTGPLPEAFRDCMASRTLVSSSLRQITCGLRLRTCPEVPRSCSHNHRARPALKSDPIDSKMIVAWVRSPPPRTRRHPQRRDTSGKRCPAAMKFIRQGRTFRCFTTPRQPLVSNRSGCGRRSDMAFGCLRSGSRERHLALLPSAAARPAQHGWPGRMGCGAS
jgi:hypothetical protein